MPVIVTREIKKKRMLIAVFAALILAALAILYFGGVLGGSSPTSSVEVSNAPGGAANQAELKTPISDAQLKILEDARFTDLQSPPGVPIKTDTTGKSNPFSD